MTPGQGHFWRQGHNLNKIGRGPLGDATYRISRLYALWFQTRRFLKFHLENLFLVHVTCNRLDMQQTGTICTFIKEGYVRIITGKFGKNPASSLGDVL